MQTKIYIISMKKLLLFTAFVACVATASFASKAKYTVDETTVENLFAQSSDVSMAAAGMNISEQLAPTFVMNLSADGDVTKKGFLIRAFFCGGFALHRSYMGTKGMFIKYCWNPIGCVDFWWVVIKGDEAFNKFKGNDKWVVWND